MAWWQFWKPAVIAADEAWIVAKLHAIAQGAQIVEEDLNAAATWIFNNYATIAQDVNAIIGIASATGLAVNPAIAAAIGVTQQALSALTAYKAAHDAGAGTGTSVIAAYHALKNTKGAYQDIAIGLTSQAGTATQSAKS